MSLFDVTGAGIGPAVVDAGIVGGAATVAFCGVGSVEEDCCFSLAGTVAGDAALDV